MDRLLNMTNENSNEIIKMALREAILENNKEINEIKNENEIIKEQEETGNYFVPLKDKPKTTFTYIAGASLVLLSQILDGFKKSAEKILEKTNKIEEERRILGMTGGQRGVFYQIGRGENETNNDGVAANNDGVAANNENSVTADQVKQDTRDYIKTVEDAQNQIDLAASKILQGDIDKMVDMESINKLKDKGFHLLENGKNIGLLYLKTGIKWSSAYLNFMLDYLLNMTGNSALTSKDLTWENLSPELNKKILLLSGVLGQLANNPASRAAIKEIANAFGIASVELLEELKPNIDKITDKMMDMTDEIAKKSASGATKTGVSVAQAAVAEIPIIGGIIDLIIALGKGFNSVMAVFRVFVEKGEPVGIDMAKAAKQTYNKANLEKKRIENAVDEAKNILDQSSKIPNLSQMQNGGAKMFIPNKKIHKKISLKNKNIRKGIEMFQKTLPKGNYTKKYLKNYRNAKNAKNTRKKSS